MKYTREEALEYLRRHRAIELAHAAVLAERELALS